MKASSQAASLRKEGGSRHVRPGGGVKAKADPISERLNNLLQQPTDAIDTVLQQELLAAMESCQNRRWAEMMIDEGAGTHERDFVCDVKGDSDYSV